MRISVKKRNINTIRVNSISKKKLHHIVGGASTYTAGSAIGTNPLHVEKAGWEEVSTRPGQAL